MAVEDVADAFFGDIPDLVGEGVLVGSLIGYCGRKEEREKEKKSLFESSQGPAIIEICTRRRKFAKQNGTRQHKSHRANNRDRCKKKRIHKKTKSRSTKPSELQKINSNRKTYPNLLIFRPSSQILPIRTKAHTADIQVTGFAC